LPVAFFQGLLEIGNQVIRVFKPHREPYKGLIFLKKRRDTQLYGWMPHDGSRPRPSSWKRADECFSFNTTLLVAMINACGGSGEGEHGPKT
jgi:hypothetical protein